MLIKEIGKQPFDFSEHGSGFTHDGGIQYEYSFITDEKKPRTISVFFNTVLSAIDTKYQMSFDDTTIGWFGFQWNAKRAQTIKNNPGAVRILTTVMAVLKDFLVKYQPDIVWFKGATERHADFYRKSLSKLNEGLIATGYRVSEQDSNTFYVQRLSRASNGSRP